MMRNHGRKAGQSLSQGLKKQLDDWASTTKTGAGRLPQRVLKPDQFAAQFRGRISGGFWKEERTGRAWIPQAVRPGSIPDGAHKKTIFPGLFSAENFRDVRESETAAIRKGTAEAARPALGPMASPGIFCGGVFFPLGEAGDREPCV